MKRILFLLLTATLLSACGGRISSKQNNENQTIYVTILPLKGLVEAIVGPMVEVKVLVPAGASPETFEPTPRQLVELAEAKLVIGVGLIDFEQSLLRKLQEERPVVHLAEGVTVMAGSCSHCHNGHTHAHGIDPHIWTSPRELKILTANLFEALQATWPDSTAIRTRCEELILRLDSLDRATAQALQEAEVESFMIYHPAMSYYARAYGIEQVAIEHEGKEPSAKRLAELIEQGRNQGVRHIFYQSQFPASSVEVLARDLGGEAVAFDPLKEDIIGEIGRFTTQLCQQNQE